MQIRSAKSLKKFATKAGIYMAFSRFPFWEPEPRAKFGSGSSFGGTVPAPQHCANDKSVGVSTYRHCTVKKYLKKTWCMVEWSRWRKWVRNSSWLWQLAVISPTTELPLKIN